MVRCGELCKSCSHKCNDIVGEGERIEIQCPQCEGDGQRGGEPCEACIDGFFQVTQCPKKEVGGLSEWIWLCGQEQLPESGGLLDQPAWFLDLKQTLQSEHNAIDEERLARLDG